MNLAQKYRKLATESSVVLPQEIKNEIEECMKINALRSKFEAVYIIPTCYYQYTDTIKNFLSEEGCSYEYIHDYQGRSLKIKF